MIFLKDKVIIGQGFKHQVFGANDVVYKVLKDDFVAEDIPSDYTIEMKALSLLRKNGFPVPDYLEIVPPEQNDLNKWCLKESLVRGKQYKDDVISSTCQKEIFDCIVSIGSITGTHYGSLGGDALCATWHDCLYSILDKYSHIFRNYCQIPGSLSLLRAGIQEHIPASPKPCLNIMDTNVMNFFFDNQNRICGIIDVDHPIFSDIDFLYMMIKWNRDDWFDRDDWYALWVKDRIFIPEITAAIYEFILAYDDVCMRHIAKRIRPASSMKLMELERRMVELLQ